jgi:hypothetical protein
MAVGLALVTVVLAVLVLKRRKRQTLTSARS